MLSGPSSYLEHDCRSRTRGRLEYPSQLIPNRQSVPFCCRTVRHACLAMASVGTAAVAKHHRRRFCVLPLGGSGLESGVAVCLYHISGQESRVWLDVHEPAKRKAGQFGGIAGVRMEPALACLLHEWARPVTRLIRSVNSVDEFMHELVKLVDAAETQGVMADAHGAAGDQKSALLLRPTLHGGGREGIVRADFYERVLHDLHALGWQHVKHVHASFQSVSLIVRESKSSNSARSGRELVLDIAFDHEYPHGRRVCTIALPPTLLNVSAIHSTTSLSFKELHAHYVQVVDSARELLDVLDDIDAHCAVLEPRTGAYDAAFRRVALGNHSSLMVEFDPLNALNGAPICRFLGAGTFITPLQRKWSHGAASWCEMAPDSELPRARLERILGITFERPDAFSEADDNFSTDCSICYAYHIEDPGAEAAAPDARAGSARAQRQTSDGRSVPDTACEAHNCARMYHRACLIEWFRSLPNTRSTLGSLIGECPYCTTMLLVRMS
ncbi:E3 ubiquitin-protein ligase FANCL [Porphyridium purpureum]|uniref:E3 ubiquitin-protein ligase FANCL n=1 Tax=Porphyridium purpureum TaxID=35688 RepID=A0A5J4YVQ0_PORPP|nr:E3 ubiquitin-protein ligase FANCL [Porphyridium purpureum]|eukprot:POR2044..scf227_4